MTKLLFNKDAQFLLHQQMFQAILGLSLSFVGNKSKAVLGKILRITYKTFDCYV